MIKVASHCLSGRELTGPGLGVMSRKFLFRSEPNKPTTAARFCPAGPSRRGRTEPSRGLQSAGPQSPVAVARAETKQHCNLALQSSGLLVTRCRH